MPQLPGTPSQQGEVLPRQFGKYMLLRLLATGGMAELYLALLRAVAGFEKLVVIKCILPELTRDKAFVEMLLHEARVAATLSHQNIVQTFDVGEVGGIYFIAMEHINGEDIRSVVRAMKRFSLAEFPLEHALTIAMAICAGLAYAHEKRDLQGVPLNIVHRDISPQNALVTFTGDVKLVDFGIAKTTEQAVGEKTAAGQLKGKVPYMSPEQARGQPIDHRSDIFSTGILLFELSTGRRLFKAKSEYDTLKLICERTYPRPSQVKPGIPPELDRIVMKALEKRVEERYQSAREMQADLETFVRNERIATSTVSLGNWMRTLFEEKIQQQKAVLSDIKQLADVIASQRSEPGDMFVGYGPTSTAGASATISTRTDIGAYTAIRRSYGRRWALIGALVVLVGLAGAYLVQRQIMGRPAGPAASAAASGAARAEAKGAVKIKTYPDGCDVWIGGELQKGVTPTTVPGLPLDREIEVKLTKEGFESYREKVVLTSDAPTEELEVKMVKGSVTVVLKVTPKPIVKIDGKPWTGQGDSIEGLSAEEEHEIVLAAVGYVPKAIKFKAEKGETKTIVEALAKAEAKPAGSGAALDVPGKPKGQGTISVNSKGGYCNVTINGRGYGPTPVAGISVAEGFAAVSCRTPDGKTLSSGTKVEAGKSARVTFNLR
ncbi:MAG: serine/threonine protein kinase [Deltaproteobacteria bacterium]|nr:serine/threonine protein kinase [Deltaproteobacteria bacterium]